MINVNNKVHYLILVINIRKNYKKNNMLLKAIFYSYKRLYEYIFKNINEPIINIKNYK